MDKKPFDHIEDRIRQAAENVSPPFNEKGWDKMQVLLDKEFHKDRRPLIAVWWSLMLLLLLGGGGAIYYHLNNRDLKGKKSEPTQVDKAINKIGEEQKLKPDNAPGNENHSKAIESVTQENSPSSNRDRKNNEGLLLKQNPQVNNDTDQRVAEKKGDFTKKGRQRSAKRAGDTHANQQKAVESFSENEYRTESNDEKETGEDNTPNGKITQIAPVPLQNDSDKAVTSIKTDSSDGNPIGIAVIKDKADKLKENKVPGRLYFIASIAPDGTAIKKFALNNVSTVYGAGLGYRLNKRLSVQAGVYGGRKIYEAGPGDYNPKKGSYLDTVNIIKIDANCFIIDIPLSLRYDLVQTKKFNVYSVAGLSTFIMKEESYDYHYRYRYNGAYNSYESSYSGNKHLFSVADLSMGFEYKLSNAFFIQAEPYIKVPLDGVGEGKVKLYSAGLQFGIKYQPLKKKSEK